ncbi:hypothetical protein [Hydrogenophaga sp. R2]|uniref:hypothetical protein n=1 Tax=Hydrogenophaga sp. R2 TaxID=3132827 RepID=UPI003CF151F7
MDRVFESGAAGLAPAAPASPSSGFPTGGNPSGGVPATKPGPYWFHMVTEEMRAVIVDAGLTPDHLALNQVLLAIKALINSAGVSTYSATQVLPAADVRKTILFLGGSANATFTLPALSSVPVGGSISIKHATTGVFVLTVQRAGTDVILPGSGSINSFAMLVGDSVTLVATAGGWHIANGSVVLAYASGAPLLGVNQSWQNLTGSRTAGTTYTNTTGRPIAVFAAGPTTTTSNALVLSVGGVTAASMGTAAAGSSLFVTGIVPPGATYSISVSGGVSINAWSELR